MVGRIFISRICPSFGSLRPKALGFSARSLCSDATVSVRWKNKDGTIVTVKGKEGQNLMRLAHQHGIELEGMILYMCECCDILSILSFRRM